MVTSGRGPSDRDIDHFCAATREIKSLYRTSRSAYSLGLMDDAKAERLAGAGVGWVNHTPQPPSEASIRRSAAPTPTPIVSRRCSPPSGPGLKTAAGAIVGMG
jgi:biotin synthase-like enzyme